MTLPRELEIGCLLLRLLPVSRHAGERTDLRWSTEQALNAFCFVGELQQDSEQSEARRIIWYYSPLRHFDKKKIRVEERVLVAAVVEARGGGSPSASPSTDDLAESRRGTGRDGGGTPIFLRLGTSTTFRQYKVAEVRAAPLLVDAEAERNSSGGGKEEEDLENETGMDAEVQPEEAEAGLGFIEREEVGATLSMEDSVVVSRTTSGRSCAALTNRNSNATVRRLVSGGEETLMEGEDTPFFTHRLYNANSTPHSASSTPALSPLLAVSVCGPHSTGDIFTPHYPSVSADSSSARRVDGAALRQTSTKSSVHETAAASPIVAQDAGQAVQATSSNGAGPTTTFWDASHKREEELSASSACLSNSNYVSGRWSHVPGSIVSTARRSSQDQPWYALSPSLRTLRSGIAPAEELRTAASVEQPALSPSRTSPLAVSFSAPAPPPSARDSGRPRRPPMRGAHLRRSRPAVLDSARPELDGVRLRPLIPTKPPDAARLPMH